MLNEHSLFLEYSDGFPMKTLQVVCWSMGPKDSKSNDAHDWLRCFTNAFYLKIILSLNGQNQGISKRWLNSSLFQEQVNFYECKQKGHVTLNAIVETATVLYSS